MAERRTEYVSIDDLIPAPRNAKGHDADHMARSVEEFGWVEPIVHDGRTGMIVSGHGRREFLLRAREEGIDVSALVEDDALRIEPDGRWLTPVGVGWSSRDDAHAEAAGIAVNRVGEGVWDMPTLADALDDLVTRYGDAIGFSPMDLDDLRLSIAPPALDDLAEQLGAHDPTDAWPSFRVRLPPDLAARMTAWWAALEGATDIDKAKALTS